MYILRRSYSVARKIICKLAIALRGLSLTILRYTRECSNCRLASSTRTQPNVKTQLVWSYVLLGSSASDTLLMPVVEPQVGGRPSQRGVPRLPRSQRQPASWATARPRWMGEVFQNT